MDGWPCPVTLVQRRFRSCRVREYNARGRSFSSQPDQLSRGVLPGVEQSASAAVYFLCRQRARQNEMVRLGNLRCAPKSDLQILCPEDGGSFIAQLELS